MSIFGFFNKTNKTPSIAIRKESEQRFVMMESEQQMSPLPRERKSLDIQDKRPNEATSTLLFGVSQNNFAKGQSASFASKASLVRTPSAPLGFDAEKPQTTHTSPLKSHKIQAGKKHSASSSGYNKGDDEDGADLFWGKSLSAANRTTGSAIHNAFDASQTDSSSSETESSDSDSDSYTDSDSDSYTGNNAEHQHKNEGRQAPPTTLRGDTPPPPTHFGTMISEEDEKVATITAQKDAEFIGGEPPSLSEEEMKHYFARSLERSSQITINAEEESKQLNEQQLQGKIRSKINSVLMKNMVSEREWFIQQCILPALNEVIRIAQDCLLSITPRSVCEQEKWTTMDPVLTSFTSSDNYLRGTIRVDGWNIQSADFSMVHPKWQKSLTFNGKISETSPHILIQLRNAFSTLKCLKEEALNLLNMIEPPFSLKKGFQEYLDVSESLVVTAQECVNGTKPPSKKAWWFPHSTQHCLVSFFPPCIFPDYLFIS
eukprot:TRINITY_DN2807_c0_g1_i2.p1 TRINITY_DN2807_c0_g1~~TRINITY_DN2807_c0_g1_i2.p1  ORF type:complete len:487 (+),score=131.43 TRINITY_DN2807_c0_g1_i2:103-1563(+)